MPRRVGHSSGPLNDLPELPTNLELQWNKTEQNETVSGVSKKTRFRHCSLRLMEMSHVFVWKFAVYAHTSRNPKIAQGHEGLRLLNPRGKQKTMQP